MTLHLPNLNRTTPLSRSSGRRICPLAQETRFDPQSDKLIQFAIDLPPIQPCTVCSGASSSNGLCQLVTLTGIKTSTVK